MQREETNIARYNESSVGQVDIQKEFNLKMYLNPHFFASTAKNIMRQAQTYP